MKAKLRTIDDHGVVYDALMFVCPGCVAGGPSGYDGIHMLPVNTMDVGKPSWDWDGNLERPTLNPSILTQGYSRCHSFLRDGIFEFLGDSDHPLAGQRIPIPDLPDWAVELSDAVDEEKDEVDEDEDDYEDVGENSNE